MKKIYGVYHCYYDEMGDLGVEKIPTQSDFSEDSLWWLSRKPDGTLESILPYCK